MHAHVYTGRSSCSSSRAAVSDDSSCDVRALSVRSDASSDVRDTTVSSRDVVTSCETSVQNKGAPE